MHKSVRLLLSCAAFGLLLGLCGCPPPSKDGGKSPKGANGSEGPGDTSPYYEGENLNYSSINVGLKAQALDLIADNAPLCGAKTGSMFFFGDANPQETGIYKRDLQSGKRTLVTTVKQIDSESLNCSNDGSILAYAKLRPIQDVIDNPDFNYPQAVAELYRVDTSTSEEVKLFNFGTDFADYRNDQLFPFISEDGQRIVCLSYDIHRLLLQTQCLEWLNLFDKIQEGKQDRTPEQQKEDDENMRVFLRADHIAPKLREMGFDPTADTAIDKAAREAVKGLFEKFRDPIMALLIWEAGTTSKLILTPAAGQERSLHFILAVSGDRILMGAKEPNSDPAEPQEIFSVDMASGQLSPFGSYQGAPSLIEFDGSGQNLVVAYNPIDTETRNIKTETHVRKLSLSGAEPVDFNLGADYFGYLDLDAEAKVLVGQNRDDLWLYSVDVASGAARKLSAHFVDLGGLYLDGPGKHAVYIENRISFSLEIPEDPQSSPNWVAESYFDPYKQKVSSFLATAGFQDDGGYQYRFEERTGMGVSETSVEISRPDDPNSTALFRYNQAEEGFGSLWIPVPGVLKLKPEFQKKGLDYYDCVELAEGIMDRLGWQNPETREPWYPGASPLYDGKSDSFIVTFRDGYWYDPAKKDLWINNSEVTMRIVAKTGDIAEINYQKLPEEHSQPINPDIAKADFQIRNYGNQPIPEDAPVRFDYEKTRLLVVTKKPDVVTPGDYASQIQHRIVYEVSAYIMPEDELVLGTLVDAETFEVFGQINYMPQGINNPNVPVPGGSGSGAPPAASGAPDSEQGQAVGP